MDDSVPLSGLRQNIVHHLVRRAPGFRPFTSIEQSIPDRFEDQTSKYPDRIAVKSRNYSFTYDALNRYANRISHAILALRGIGEEVIAIILEKDAPLLAAFLGVVKTGKIYVALDPNDPQARASKILEDAQSGLIITDDKNLAAASELSRDTLQILNISQINRNLPEDNIELSIGPETPACILYTSGSTGQPKGVIQTHRNVLHKIKRNTNSFCISKDDRIALLSSSNTALALADIYGALLNGAAVCPFNVQEEGYSRLDLWLRQEEITLLQIMSSLFRCLLSRLGSGEAYPSLRLVRVGGDQLYRHDAELFKLHFSPACVLVNSLGSTEAGNVREFFIGKETRISGNLVPVGFPVDDMEISLVDEAGHPVGFGSPGEITIRSEQLSPGYWRRPELTQQVLLAGPDGGNSRIFRTGDMGRMTEGGCLEYLGRRDAQVKIRGYRVETGEVEALLVELRQIKQAAVVARQNGAREWQLFAYVVTERQEAITAEELRSHLREKLPEYMLPAKFVFLDALPMTSSGKVHSSALPAPEEIITERPQRFCVPRDPIELQLTKIWEEVLNLRPIGVLDNFFDLGGNSLEAIKMFLDVEKVFGRNLTPTTIFEAPTIEKLARILRQEKYGVPSLVLLQSAASGHPLFCVPGPRNSVFAYLELARALGSDHPIYGLRAPTADKERSLEPAFWDPKELAPHYIKQMRSIQPEGPYLLGGYSASGIVAFEIAQRLRAEGQDVALLALFDTFHPGYFQFCPSRYTVHTWAQKTSRVFHEFLGKSFKEEALYIGRLCRALKNRTKRKFWRLLVSFLSVSDAAIAQRAASGRETLISWRARDYTPQPYPGRVTIFRACCSAPYFSQDLGWSRVAMGGIEIHEVPGDHVTMLAKPHVWSLVKELKSCLERATEPDHDWDIAQNVAD